jgi:hypothetical protein
MQTVWSDHRDLADLAAIIDSGEHRGAAAETRS